MLTMERTLTLKKIIKEFKGYKNSLEINILCLIKILYRRSRRTKQNYDAEEIKIALWKQVDEPIIEILSLIDLISKEI